MTIAQVLKRAEKFTIDNSPLILTAIGVTGTLSVAYLSGKASFTAAEIIWAEQQEEGMGVVPFKKKVNLVWKEYIPAAIVGTLTIAAIVNANRIGTRRTAAIAAAYSIAEKAHNEYIEKVTEKLGEKKERQARDELAQERVDRSLENDKSVVVIGNGEVMCYEHYTDRYFMTSVEALKKAQNDLNYRINSDFYASLSDFYDLVGLPHTSISDDVGWNSDKLMELDISTTLGKDGQPCLSIDYHVEPVRKYFRHG